MNPTTDTKELRRKISEAQFIRDNAVPVVTLTEDDARGLADTIDRLAADLAKARDALKSIAIYEQDDRPLAGDDSPFDWRRRSMKQEDIARRTLAEIER